MFLYFIFPSICSPFCQWNSMRRQPLYRSSNKSLHPYHKWKKLTLINLNSYYIMLHKPCISTIHQKKIKHARISQCAGCHIPLADSFLVLMIFAAYSCPDDFFTHLRTTEKAPLKKKKNINNQKWLHTFSLTTTQSVTFENVSACGSCLFCAW